MDSAGHTRGSIRRNAPFFFFCSIHQDLIETQQQGPWWSVWSFAVYNNITSRRSADTRRAPSSAPVASLAIKSQVFRIILRPSTRAVHTRAAERRFWPEWPLSFSLFFVFSLVFSWLVAPTRREIFSSSFFFSDTLARSFPWILLYLYTHKCGRLLFFFIPFENVFRGSSLYRRSSVPSLWIYERRSVTP